MVLTARGQAGEKLGRSGALIGRELRAGAHVDQRVWLLRPRGDDAARAVIFEGAPDEHLIIGKQRGGKGIPLKSAHPLGIEGKFNGAAPLDQAAAFLQTGAHLKPFQSGRLALIFAMISAGGAPTCAG